MTARKISEKYETFVEEDKRPLARDMLAEAIEHLRPKIADHSLPLKRRIRLIWGAAKVCRELGSSDVVEAELIKLTNEVRLIVHLGRHGTEDLVHIIRWGLLGHNPFETGPLQ
jgi:hypothetical protein